MALIDKLVFLVLKLEYSWIIGAINSQGINSSSPAQNGPHFVDDIFKCIFLNEKFCILIRISRKLLPKGLINDTWTMLQVMAWRRIGDKPLPEQILIQFADAYMRH